MQVAKEDVRQLILSTARQAFFQKGYHAVSMRQLAALSGVSLSNIYNYYASKEDILNDILEPLIGAMNGMLEMHADPTTMPPDWFISREYHRENVTAMLGIVLRYRNELRLLLYSVQNTRFEHLVDQWLDRATDVSIDFMQRLGERAPHLRTQLSPALLRFSVSSWLTVMRQVVDCDSMTGEQVQRFIEEFVEYATGGWAMLLRVPELHGKVSSHVMH